jgi:hypothetical protein
MRPSWHQGTLDQRIARLIEVRGRLAASLAKSDRIARLARTAPAAIGRLYDSLGNHPCRVASGKTKPVGDNASLGAMDVT